MYRDVGGRGKVRIFLLRPSIHPRKHETNDEACYEINFLSFWALAVKEIRVFSNF